MAEVVVFHYGHHWSLVNFKFRYSRQTRVPLTGSSCNNTPVSKVCDSGENSSCPRPRLPLSGDLHAFDFTSIGYVLGRNFSIPPSISHFLQETVSNTTHRRWTKVCNLKKYVSWIQSVMQLWVSYWDISDRPLECKTIRKYNISWLRIRHLQLNICFNSNQEQ